MYNPCAKKFMALYRTKYLSMPDRRRFESRLLSLVYFKYSVFIKRTAKQEVIILSVKIKKADVIALIVILILTAVFFLVFRTFKSQGKTVIVRVSGEETASYSLDKDRTETINGANGGTNLLVIEDGTVCLKEASCPDKLCVNQGKISKRGESIICLPNEVIVEISSDDDAQTEDDGFDAVAK